MALRAGSPLRGRMGAKVEAHAYMQAKGVPQLLDSVLKQLLLAQPDDAVGFMVEVLRRASAGLEGGKEAAGGETSPLPAQPCSPTSGRSTPSPKSADTLRVHAEFTDASGVSTQTHMLRVSAARCGRTKLLEWCEEAHLALQDLVCVGPLCAANVPEDEGGAGPGGPSSSGMQTPTSGMSRMTSHAPAFARLAGEGQRSPAASVEGEGAGADWSEADTDAARARKGLEALGLALLTAPKNLDGSTPLLLAAREGQEMLGVALVEAGADIDAQDKDGAAPLHWAAMHSLESLALALLKAGAEIDGKDADGNTPLLLVNPKPET
ncbi:hypothetical protein T484DRAFT_2090034 [Baffinella frigidus]|nr:hypothetical protein T484DRAFT_2090034 [Cryptophyta sp. CCMP2293]